ncbi:MAG: cyclic nucleotide-binding domain-containing protein [Actinomycetota bacterium]
MGSDLTSAQPLIESLRRLALFSDLPAEALEALTETVRDERVEEGTWILTEGDENADLFVILEGEVGLVRNEIEAAVMHSGMFFGEVSVLLDEPAIAGVVARTPVRCAVIDRAALIPFLLANPTVTLRLLQAEARRIADANPWRA